MSDDPELRLPPTPAEWEAVKSENAKLLLQIEELRSSLAEMVQGLNGLDSDRRWPEEIEDAEKLLQKTNPEKRKCDKHYAMTEDSYGYCGREIGHDGEHGRN